MPQWIALLAIVVVAWMILAVVGGWLIGRGLRAIDHHADTGELDTEPVQDLRRAA
jgi:hypothetical protein